jgi:hypothetical protein
MRFSILWISALLACGCSTSPVPATAWEPFDAWNERVQPSGLATAPSQPTLTPEVQLERISTGVPWPRGLVALEKELVVLARGRHRRSGGCDARIEDRSGSLFSVDPSISEPVAQSTSDRVRTNSRPLAAPAAPPFYLWDRQQLPVEDVLMDRPYCTLAYDAQSDNFFICGFSGVDLPQSRFRKNATDSIHRFDRRTGGWHAVEMHRADVVPGDQLGWVVPNQYYPHHDPAKNAPPHGWLNGPDGAEVVGDFLYAVGKDNHSLVQYDLRDLRQDADAGPPNSRFTLGDRVRIRVGNELRPLRILGHSAVAAFEGYLYLGFRTSSQVIRIPLTADGDVVQPVVGELIAEFAPWDPETQDSANLIDLAFNSRGELFASCATRGRIWKIGIPDPDEVFDGNDERASDPTLNQPWVDLRVLTGKPDARVGNIAFDPQDRLYLCSGNYDAGTEIAGVIYRAMPVSGS